MVRTKGYDNTNMPHIAMPLWLHALHVTAYTPQPGIWTLIFIARLPDFSSQSMTSHLATYTLVIARHFYTLLVPSTSFLPFPYSSPIFYMALKVLPSSTFHYVPAV